MNTSNNKNEGSILSCISSEPEISTILHEKGRALGLPISGTFELTSDCNFSCKMCYIHSLAHAKNKELSSKEWIRLAEEAKKSGTVFLLLTGGEPLMRNDFKEIYTAIKDMGFIVSINTNGSLIDDATARLFIENPPSKLNISIYGAKKATYKSLCNNNAFDKVINNILHLKKNGIEIKLNYSITPENCEDYEKIYSFAVEHKLNIKATTYMYPKMRSQEGVIGQNNGRLTAEAAAKFRIKWDLLQYGKDEFNRRAQGLKLLSKQQTLIPAQSEKMRCRAGTTSFWISSSGLMSTCGVMEDKSFDALTLGFSEAWERVKANTACYSLPKECSNCQLRPICNVCAAACLCEAGSTDSLPDYVCRLSEKSMYYYLHPEEAIK